MSQVSVVITTYDRPEFLAGAIDTALGQTHTPLEIIVVDDGSTTEYAVETVARYPEKVRCIRHDQNRGPSAARNAGIEAAEGAYIAFLDDDDRWHRSKLDRQTTVLDRNPDVGLVTCSTVVGTPDGTIRYCNSVERPAGDLVAEITRGNPIGETSRVLVRRACIDDVGPFDESFPTTQDYEFYIRVCQRWDVVFLDEYLLYRTLHAKNISDDVNARARDVMRIYRKHESLIRRHHDWEDILRRYHLRRGRGYLGVGEFRAARGHSRLALANGFTGRGILLYLLSFTTPRVFDLLVAMKRALKPPNPCTDLTETVDSRTFPGIGDLGSDDLGGPVPDRNPPDLS